MLVKYQKRIMAINSDFHRAKRLFVQVDYVRLGM